MGLLVWVLQKHSGFMKSALPLAGLHHLCDCPTSTPARLPPAVWSAAAVAAPLQTCAVQHAVRLHQHRQDKSETRSHTSNLVQFSGAPALASYGCHCLLAMLRASITWDCCWGCYLVQLSAALTGGLVVAAHCRTPCCCRARHTAYRTHCLSSVVGCLGCAGC
jgi:hypothetical protein